MTDTNIQRYREIKRGDIVSLSDEQTIKQLMEDGVVGAMDGMDLEVESVRCVDSESMAQYYFCDLTGQPNAPTSLILLIKIVDDQMDRRIYWAPDDVDPGSRSDLIENGCEWLFEEPDNRCEFIPSELSFTKQIVQHVEQYGEVCYAIKGAEVHGEHREVCLVDSRPQPATIVEWIAQTDIENPELLVLEVGGLDENGECLTEGGYVVFLQGASVDGTDIQLLSK